MAGIVGYWRISVKIERRLLPTKLVYHNALRLSVGNRIPSCARRIHEGWSGSKGRLKKRMVSLLITLLSFLSRSVGGILAILFFEQVLSE
jgi:hypothetical protein